MDKKELGARIQKFRNALNLNQEELAYQIGMNASGFGKVERGQNKLQVDYIPALVRALKIDANELLDIKPLVSEENEKMGFASKSEVNLLAQRLELLTKKIDSLLNELPKKSDSYRSDTVRRAPKKRKK